MPADFNKISPFYTLLEKMLFGDRLQAYRCNFLNHMHEAERVLLVGEGTGCFLRELLATNSKVRITVVEISKEMVVQAKSKVEFDDIKRVFFHQMPLSDFVSTESYDFICTFFFWDCFEEKQIKSMLPDLVANLDSEGKLVNVDFAEPSYPYGNLHLLSFLLLRMLYGFFRLATGISALSVVEIDGIAKQSNLEIENYTEDKIFPIKGQLFRRII